MIAVHVQAFKLCSSGDAVKHLVQHVATLGAQGDRETGTKGGAMVALNLASVFVVQRLHSEITALLPCVDLLVGNQRVLFQNIYLIITQ